MSEVFEPFARQQLIAWWDQHQLAEAHVLVVGAGALGNEVLKNLALVGVGNLYIIDFDVVEPSNLSRSVLFRVNDVAEGSLKAHVAAQRTLQLNPYAQARVFSFHGDLVWDLGAGLYRRMDVVIGCLDNPEARRYVNMMCWKTEKTWIDGAMDMLSGSVAVYTASKEQACYECGVGDLLRKMANQRYSCLSGLVRSQIEAGHEPTTQTTSAIIAAIQSQEAIKVCHGMDVPGGHKLYYHGMRYNFSPEDPTVTTITELAVNPECFCHHEDRFGDVVVFDMTSQDTLERLFDQARHDLGMHKPALVFGSFHPSAQGRRFIVRAACGTPECGYHCDIHRPAHQLKDSDVICPQCAFTCPWCGYVSYGQPTCPECGQERPGMHLESVHRFTDGDLEQNYTLEQVGIPDLDVVKLVDEDSRECYVQIGQDIRRVFQCVWKEVA